MTAHVRRRALRVLIATLFFAPSMMWAQCVVPDTGTGTVTLPPAGCAYLSPADVHRIIAGLPPGTTIELGIQHERFICPPGFPPGVCSFPPPAPGDCVQSGGALGGEQECAQSQLTLTMKGTGLLAGWFRNIPLAVGMETHTGPRTPFTPVQSFDTDMFRIQGQLPPGDPDFDLLRITAGSGFGMPSPGHTTLTQLPSGQWAVDSFFDITYRIDFVGRPGGPLGGMSGSTTGTIRMATGGGPSGGQCMHGAADCDDLDPCTTDVCKLDTCIEVDNGTGTVNLPPVGCGYVSPDDVHAIIDGLPPGTEINVGVQHAGFNLTASGPGGSFPGGNFEQFDSDLNLHMAGTGALAGFSRDVSVHVASETHTGAHTPGMPVQSFPTLMFRIQGQISNPGAGDPDFDLLRITAGNAFGMPSPGHTTLTQQPNGTWAVDSFFDITYRIDFIGSPGGALGGMSGSTTGTIRMHASGGGTCVNSPVDCNDNNACTTDSCNPATGLCEHDPVNCDDGNPCTLDGCIPSFGPNCDVPDNGTGTATLPPAGCGYVSPADLHEIIDGLPAGTTIQIAATHKDFICPAASPVCSFPLPIPGSDCDEPGGTLGGEKECAGSTLSLEMTGTGMLAGFNRTIDVEIGFETHTAPRTPGDPVQSFDTDMFRLFGQITNPGAGDPDFDLLRIVGGTDFGLPSPGHTTLTQQPGGYAVDSFFDITYRIDFVGRPGGALGGMSGSTTGTIRMVTGEGGCFHRPLVCDDGDPCTADSCNPATGGCEFIPVPCDDGDPCTTDSCVSLGAPDCTVADNGTGTATLPPAGCGYVSPADVHQIIDGLPPGTTIELAAEHRSFFCPAAPGVCSFPPPVPGSDCDQAGGGLGGEQECSGSQLAMNLHGTGLLTGFDRQVMVPISFETHTAPRTPGNPVQSFDTDMFRLFGQITNPGSGDPDFDLLRIVGGTDFGLPSPGHTTLTQLPGGQWSVDSFFDITYRIDFVGRPGGALSGMSGSTTGTIRMAVGDGGCLHSPTVCDDGDLCTTDTCDSLSGGCTFAPVNCDDLVACTVDSCNPSSGTCSHVGVPPNPIGFSMAFSNPTTLKWTGFPDATHWNVYRGQINLVGPPFYNHGCYVSGSPVDNIPEPMDPPLSRVFYYLTTQENQCGESGLGTASSGAPRPLGLACPTPP